MNLTKYFVLLIFLLGSITTFAQNIQGTVLDADTKRPLEGVNVYLKNSSIGTSTNVNGFFDLNGVLDNDTIFFRYLGYDSASFSTEDFLEQQRDTLFLKQKEEILSEVKVSGRRKMRDRIIAHKLTSMPYALTGFGNTVIDGKIYVIGGDQSFFEDNVKRGFKDIDPNQPNQFSALLFAVGNRSYHSYSDKLLIYNISKDTWIKSDTEFSKRAYHSLVPSQGKLYVMGGKTLSANGVFEYLANTIEVYDIAKDTILVDHANPHQASNPLGIVYGDDILVVGGSTRMTKSGKKTYTNKIHFYNTPSGNWYDLGDVPMNFETDGTVLNNMLYVSGFDSIENKSILYRFDLISGKWDKMDELAVSFQNPRFTQGNGIIYIYQKGLLFTYEPNLGELRKYDVNIEVENPSFHFYENSLYILGGTNKKEYASHPSPELYSINIRDFQNTKPVLIQIF